MPTQTIWMIRFSLVYLLIAVLLGGLIITHKAIDLHPIIWSLLPVHFELAIWGWLVQFVMGTAYWMFPKHVQGKARGNDILAWFLVFSFNLGLILLVLPQNQQFHFPISRLLVLISIIIFTCLIFPRIKTYRKKSRSLFL